MAVGSGRVLVLFGRTHDSVWHLVNACNSNGCCDAACGAHFDADYVTCDREEPFDTVLHPGDERCSECFAGVRPLRTAEDGVFAHIMDAFADDKGETS